MIAAHLILVSVALGWFAFLTYAIFIAGRRFSWMAKPPTVDLIVILYTAAPWIAGWIAGARIHGHWAGGIAGLAAITASQILALELFDFLHSSLSAKRGIRSLEINGTIERRFGKWNNRICLWLTLPSIPFFLMNRFNFLGYFVFEFVLGFTHFRHSDYITVSRQKIQNLVGADLVWCLYCEWMTGGWTLTSEILNEIESYWCPLKFADSGKYEKCAEYFRMEHWAPADTSTEEIRHIVGRTGAGRVGKGECACPVSDSTDGASRSRRPEDSVPSGKV